MSAGYMFVCIYMCVFVYNMLANLPDKSIRVMDVLTFICIVQYVLFFSRPTSFLQKSSGKG